MVNGELNGLMASSVSGKQAKHNEINEKGKADHDWRDPEACCLFHRAEEVKSGP